MAVNKNFVVKNGLEVNENLIVANATDGFVGVGTSTPNEVLHVFGGIGATDVRVTGVSSFIQNVYVGASGTTFSVVDVTGSLPAVGVGTDKPEYLLDIRGPVGTGYTSVYIKGDVRLTGDLIADDLVFDQGNFSNLEVTGYTTTSALVVGYGASLAGISTLSNTNVTGDLNVTGVTTLASAGGITTVCGAFWVGNNFYVAGTQTIDSDLYIIGIATVGILTVTTDANVGGAVTIGGDLTVGGDLNVSGDLSYDEVTGRNLNITGIATIHTLGVTSTTTTQDLAVGGASTITGWVSLGSTVSAGSSIYLGDNTRISIGAGTTDTGDLIIYHDASNSIISNTTGELLIDSDTMNIRSKTGGESYFYGSVGAGVTLFYDNSEKLRTTNTGVLITGILTATSFVGSGQIGLGSEGTAIGTGVTFLNLASSSGAAWNLSPVSSGIMTATVTPGVSLGLAIALGG